MEWDNTSWIRSRVVHWSAHRGNCLRLTHSRQGLFSSIPMSKSNRYLNRFLLSGYFTGRAFVLMIAEIRTLFTALEEGKQVLLDGLAAFPAEGLHFQPAPGRWSMAMALQHIVLAEEGLRLSEAELRDNPVRRQLQPGKLFETVLEILEKDVPVPVPHPGLEPDNRASLEDLALRWDRERTLLRDLLERIPGDAAHEVVFSHPAAGPLDAVRALRLALAHLDTHRRQIERLISDAGFGADMVG